MPQPFSTGSNTARPWGVVMAETPGPNLGQAQFSAALMAPDRPVPDGLTGPSGRTDSRRFAVYRNNVAASLIAALGDIFPTVRRLIGAEFFHGVARNYVAAHIRPLLHFCLSMAQDLANSSPLSSQCKTLPSCQDVARLERHWLDAFHAADAPVLEPALLAGMSPDDLGRLCLVAHPAGRILDSSHAVVSILSRDRAGQSLAGLDPMQGETALVTRPECDVVVSRISPGAGAFYRALIGWQAARRSCWRSPGALSRYRSAGSHRIDARDRSFHPRQASGVNPCR